MQLACHQLRHFGFHCSKKERSNICGQLKKKLLLREVIHRGPTIQPPVQPSEFLSVEVSIYNAGNKQYTGKSCSDLMCDDASALQFLSYLPKRLDQGTSLFFNSSNLFLPVCNPSFFSAENCYRHTQQSQ